MQYLYQEGDNLVFMDTTSFEQIPFTPDQVGDAAQVPEGEPRGRAWCSGAVARSASSCRRSSRLPSPSATPAMKGDTASGATKPATIETGAVLQVPLFIKEGDVAPGRHAHRRVRRAGLAGPPEREPSPRLHSARRLRARRYRMSRCIVLAVALLAPLLVHCAGSEHGGLSSGPDNPWLRAKPKSNDRYFLVKGKQGRRHLRHAAARSLGAVRLRRHVPGRRRRRRRLPAAERLHRGRLGRLHDVLQPVARSTTRPPAT